MPACPTCNKPAQPLAQNPAFPFCSARCKTIDLGRWLNEEYRVPVQSEDGSEDQEPVEVEEESS
ncbi:MAG TPA: DNA gyrase inhibitor YacG [Polyangiaceae bacterium]